MKKIFCFLLITSTSFAFDMDKCLEGTKKYGFFLDSLVSGTQFTSSFGACSAIGRYELKRKYIADNEENLKQEMAIGRGEYLSALNEVLECPSENVIQFNHALQKRTPILINLENETFLREITNTANKICFNHI